MAFFFLRYSHDTHSLVAAVRRCIFFSMSRLRRAVRHFADDGWLVDTFFSNEYTFLENFTFVILGQWAVR